MEIMILCLTMKEVWINIIVPLLAALFGGLLALIGVLVTLKFEKKKRKEDFKLQYRPYVLKSEENFEVELLVTPVILSNIKTLNIRSVLDSSYNTEDYVIIKNFLLLNTELANLCVLGVKINNETYLFNKNEDLFVPKNRHILIQTNGNVFYCKGKFEKLELIISDIFENKYSIECIFQEKNGKWQFGKDQKVEKDIRIITVKTISNPVEIKEKKHVKTNI